MTILISLKRWSTSLLPKHLISLRKGCSILIQNRSAQLRIQKPIMTSILALIIPVLPNLLECLTKKILQTQESITLKLVQTPCAPQLLVAVKSHLDSTSRAVTQGQRTSEATKRIFLQTVISIHMTSTKNCWRMRLLMNYLK